MEGTRGIDFLFGIIIAVVCANWIAQFVHQDGVYESELDHDGNVFFLRTEAPMALQYKVAADVSLPLRPVSGVWGAWGVSEGFESLGCKVSGV